jgi:integrase
MATVRKKGRKWYARYVDENGEKREKAAYTDRRESQRLADELEAQAARIRDGLVDARDLALREHGKRPVAAHIGAWVDHLAAKGATAAHVKQAEQQARDLADKAGADRLGELDSGRVQAALKAMKDAGASHWTVSHYRKSLRAFVRWCIASGRLDRDPLAATTAYNPAEDVRRERRTLAVDELRRLIATTRAAPTWRGLTGEARSLIYRTAAGTGLRHAELASLTPDSFDWSARPATIRLRAERAKNRREAVLIVPADLADDLRAHVAPLPREAPVFPMKPTTGTLMLRADLARAGIPFEDESGRRYDFHCLRGQFASELDAAGASLRTTQLLMRHSTPTLTSKYIRPRAVDVESAVASLPSLTPADGREAVAATGTETATPVQQAGRGGLPTVAHYLPTAGDVSRRNASHPDVKTSTDAQGEMDRKSGGIRWLTLAVASSRGISSSDPGGTRTRAACVKGMCPNH